MNTPAPDQGETSSEATAKRAVTYLRVSTEDQADTDYNAEGYSLPAQREACHRLADQLGASVEDEYVDRGESAKSAKRPALQRMLTRLREQQDIDLVIVHKVDRLARNRQDDVEIDLVIRTAGARLVSASENIDDTPHGKLIRNIMADFAQYYSDNLATEAKKGARQKAKFGGTPYKPPIGYLTARERIEGREIRIVVVDLERAPLVRWGFKAYATGDYTLRELAEELERRGLKFEQSRKRPARPMTLSSVNNMLTNRYYLGMVSYEGILYPGRHEPLVDEATFEAVRAIMTARKNSGEKPKKRPHYLKGRLFCGYCGGRMGISFSRSQNKTVYPYFYCLGRQKRKSCSQAFVALEIIEAAAVQYWRRHVRLDEQRSAEIRRVVMDWLLTRQASSGKTIATQRTRIGKLEREQAKLTEAYLADALPIDVLRTEQGRIQRELSQARILIGQYQDDYQAIEAALDHALLMCRYGSLAYEHAEPEVRRQLVQAAFDKLWVIGDEIAGCDLKPGYVTLLDDDLAVELERQSKQQSSDDDGLAAAGRTYYRHAMTTSRLPDSPDIDQLGKADEDWCLPVERPSGRLPWEAKNPSSYAGVRGSNVSTLVELSGLEPLTPCLQTLWTGPPDLAFRR